MNCCVIILACLITALVSFGLGCAVGAAVHIALLEWRNERGDDDDLLDKESL